MQNHPLNKVAIIRKVVAFRKTQAPEDLLRLAYVNNSWNDTIKNYSFHLFEKQVRTVKSDVDLENGCRCSIKCGVIWFVKALMFSKTVLDRINVPRLVCENKAASLDMARFVFAQIGSDDLGGRELLKNQLVSTDGDGLTSLMLCCRNASSPEVMELAFEKISELGGPDLLMSQLSATDTRGWSCLMIACGFSSSAEVVKVVFEKIENAGGPALVKSQLSLTNKSGSNCLMLGCSYSTSPQVVKLVFERIVEVGGTEFLQSQVAETDGIGLNCLTLSCGNSESPEVAKLLAAVLLELGLFKQQYENLNNGDNNILRIMDQIKGAWVADAETPAEVKMLLEQHR